MLVKEKGHEFDGERVNNGWFIGGKQKVRNDVTIILGPFKI